MATVSFKKAQPAVPAAEITPPARAETVGAVATITNSPQIQGEFTSRDMAVPYLNLGQKSGTMCDERPEWVGKWVYDKELCLGNEVKALFLRLRKSYEEIREFGDPEIPQRFATSAEYRAAGFNDSQVRDVAEIDLLLECSHEELEDKAMLDADETAWAPARYVVRSSAYGKTVGILLKDLAGWLKNDLPSGCYILSTEKRTGSGNSWHVPKLAAAGKASENLRNAIREKFGV